MEAAPRLPMLYFELKFSPEPTVFDSALRQYIRTRYEEDPDSYSNEIKELNALRQTACKVPKDFTGCSILKRYYSQLQLLQPRFPMTQDAEASINFMWYDIFSAVVYNVNDIKYEQACILYNIGALHSELGGADNRHSSEGMKVSCTHFQCAAWAFQHLRDEYPQARGSDMAYDLISFYINVLLAQAQECILEKSIQDNRKSTIISKVSIQIVEYYKAAQKILDQPKTDDDNSTVADIVGSKQFKVWKKYITTKMAYYKAISCLYQGNQAEEQQKMGERVAYYEGALDALNETSKTSKGLEDSQLKEAISFCMDVISGKLNASKRENDFVYHEKVPTLDTLQELKGASLVKGIPFDPTDPEVSGIDIFARLVPMEAHEAASLYSEEKAKLLREMDKKLEEKDNNLTVFMSSLQLEHLTMIDEVTRNTIPQELVERCAALSVRPTAVSDLVAAMQALSNICTDVDSDLKDIAEIVDEEDNKEKDYQEIIGKRATSILSVELKNEMKKYVEAHGRASESNATLHKALSIHIQNLKQLSQSLDDLQASLPSLESESFDQSSVVEMNRLLAKIEQMKQQRRQLETTFRNDVHNDDITKRVMAIGKDADMQTLFQQELKKFESVVGLLEQNMAAQENVLLAITEANAKFAETRKTVVEASTRRESKIRSLLASYDAYEDLLHKTQKGTEFYRKLQTNVNKLLNRMKSVYKVQEEERMQVIGSSTIKDVNQSSIDMSTGPKLKDYLPYMTERGSVKVTDSNVMPPIMGMRPTPVGAELTGPSPTCSPQNLPHVNKIPDVYRQIPAQKSTGDFSSSPANYPSSVQPVISSEPTYPVQSVNVANPHSHNVVNNVPNISALPPASKMYDVKMAYPGQPNNQQVQSVFPNPQLQQQILHSYINTPKDAPRTPMSGAQPYQPVSQFSMPSSHPSSVPNFTKPPTHVASSYAPSNTYQLPLPGVSSSATFQQYPYAAVSQNPPQVPYEPPGQSTGNQGSQAPHYQSAPFYQQPQIKPTYQQPQSVSMNYLPQTVYSNERPQPTPSASQQQTHPPLVNQQSQAAHVSQNFQDGNPYSEKVNISTYYNEQSNQPLPSRQQTNYQYPQNNCQSQVPASTVPYSQNSNVPAPQIYYQQQPVSQPSQVPFQKPSLIGKTPSANNGAGTNVHPAMPPTQLYPQPQRATTGNYSQPLGYQQYQTRTANPVVSTYQTPASISQNYSGNNAFQQQFQVPNQQPQTANFQPVNNNIARQNVAPVYAQTVANENPALMQPLQPQPYSSTVKSIPINSTVASTQQSGARTTQPVTMASPRPSPTHKPPSSPPIEITSDSKTQQQSNQLRLQHSNDSRDLLSSTPENRKDDKSNVLEPKVLTAEELQLQKEELQRQSVQKDPYLDSEFLTKFTNEVKRYEKFVEGLMNPTLMGQTPLEQKWEEFISTQDKESRKHLISVARCYPIKNRNQDLMPYDENRVEIKSLKDDYINASYISGISESGPKFIVTQSPLPSTYTDFWSMVWEQQTEIIICLLSDSELKGHVYWPTERGQVSGHGPVKLSLQSSKNKTFCVEKMINITHHETGISRVAIHLQFTCWPVMGLPESPIHLLQFITDIHSYHRQQRSLVRPVVVHCSGGSGRSGILCLLSAAVQDMNCGRGIIDVLSTVIRMCTQRKYIIYDKEQLRFCYEAVLYHARDMLLKRGILTNQSSFESKQGCSTPNRHVRHPSEDFILGSGSLSTIQSKLGMDVPATSTNSNENQASADSGTHQNVNESELVVTHTDGHKEVCSNADLMMEQAKNIDPKPITEDSRNELASLLDPKTFSLEATGTPTKKKISKEDFSSPQKGSLQQNVDPNDPLSLLDPLWSVKN